jgi:hypothetical protein
MQANKEISFISGRKIKALDGFSADQFEGLAKIGIHIPKKVVRDMMNHYAMDGFANDALQPTVTRS